MAALVFSVVWAVILLVRLCPRPAPRNVRGKRLARLLVLSGSLCAR